MRKTRLVMKNFSFRIIFFFLLTGVLPVFAEPVIDNTSGTVVDKSSVTVIGLNFGSNQAVGTSDIEWVSDYIENATVGEAFQKNRWVQDSLVETIDQAVARYDNTQSHSGNNSISIYYYKNPPTIGRYRGWMDFRRDDMSKVYVTYWTRGNWDGISDGQWKQIRVQRGASPVDNNGGPGIYITKLYYNNLVTNFPEPNTGNYSMLIDSNICTDCTTGPGNEQYMPDNSLVGMTNTWDKWMRYEVYLEDGTPGVRDGTIVFKVHEPGVGIRNPVNYNGCVKMRNVGVTYHFNHVILGHYSGSGGGTSFSSMTGFWDDIFIQVGTQARVEIGDVSTWNDCTHREIQIPTIWQDNSITFTFNQGSFNNGDTVYLYVVDENGNANANGFPLTIGQGENVFDLNSDGKVDMTDVQACVDHILGVQDWGANADVNGDGAVNIVDVQAIVNTILGN